MNYYQREQWEAWKELAEGLGRLFTGNLDAVREDIQPYLAFRREVDEFLSQHFKYHCTTTCYENNRSACCSKDGILTFWADLVVNALSGGLNGSDVFDGINAMLVVVQSPHSNLKCIYLTPRGCCWRVRPLVCSMFLCDTVQLEVFGRDPDAGREWKHLDQRARAFRWPDRPVLFDRLEARFMALGCRSALMYLNNSPGLLRVKQRAGTNCVTKSRF